jgi:hypothetical protein
MPEQLSHAIARESQRAERKKTGSDLSLVLFRVNRPRRGPMSLSTLRLVKTVIDRIRVTDDLGWYDKNHLGLLLPDTPSEGAWSLAQDVSDVIARRQGTRPLITMYTYPLGEKPATIRSSEMEQRPIKVAS